jgi:hypothetical protein
LWFFAISQCAESRSPRGMRPAFLCVWPVSIRVVVSSCALTVAPRFFFDTSERAR